MAGVWRVMGEVSLETTTAVLCLETCSLVWHKQVPLTGPASAQAEVPGPGSELRSDKLFIQVLSTAGTWWMSEVTVPRGTLGAAGSLPALSSLAPSPAVTLGIHVLGI